MGLANRISLCHKYYMYAGAKHENASRCVKSRMKKVNWNRYSKVKVFQNSQMFGNSVGDSFFACYYGEPDVLGVAPRTYQVMSRLKSVLVSLASRYG